jgi:hypothetical protein
LEITDYENLRIGCLREYMVLKGKGRLEKLCNMKASKFVLLTKHCYGKDVTDRTQSTSDGC